MDPAIFLHIGPFGGGALATQSPCRVWLAMPTVLGASFDLFRAHGMTTIFGNPGSTELPMLADFPTDFRYVLGLQEAVVVGMADGYAQASGRTTVANLHTAPGVGNAMGAIFNAQANHSPLLVTAGQQVRAQMTLQANLTNRDAIRMPHPLVKWAYEPARAEDVPLALAHGLHLASMSPRGPVFVSLPMDDWGVEVDDADAREVIARRVTGRAVADPEAIAALAERLDAASNPVLVAGPDIDASGGWKAAIGLAERQRLPVWATPAPGGGRIGFPEDHPNYRGVLPPAIGPVAQTLEGHDLILVAGSSVFPYYPYIPGPLLPEGAELVAITSDPDEAARAPMGDAIVADVGLSLAALREAAPESSRPAPEPNQGPQELPASDPLNSSTVHSALAEVFPEDGIVVLESPASTLALRNQLRLSRPGSYYFSSGGGLGFGLAASVGVQLAQPDRPVVCVLGEGSAQYAISAFWSAVAYSTPVTFLVLHNAEYAILKWFADVEGVTGAPGLDLPELNVGAVAAGYGVSTRRASGRDEVREALESALASSQPELVEVPVEPGMSLF
jgi:benzoylformate decarboxylase